jgi:SAM-dependent methyltransferase
MALSMRSRLRAFLADAREHGASHATLTAVRWLAQRTLERSDDALLELEGRRGILGPAHRRWSANSAEANRARWQGWDWSGGGEEWTASEQWKQALLEEVLGPTIPPGGTVLEIGPGAGRWTQALVERAERLIVADVAPVVLELIAERFPAAQTILSGGCDLTGVEDTSVDAIWSFDVFVHVAPSDQAGYLAEIARVLKPGGVAVIHHANGRNRGHIASRQGWRSPMTVELFAALARDRALNVTGVIDHWSQGTHDLGAYHDAITVLQAQSAHKAV